MTGNNPRDWWLRFPSGSGWSGFPIGAVRQVVHLGEVQPVPRAPAFLRGVTEVQGRLYTVLDPRRFAGAADAATESEVAVLLNPPHGNLAMVVPAWPEVILTGSEAAVAAVPVAEIVIACEQQMGQRRPAVPGRQDRQK